MGHFEEISLIENFISFMIENDLNPTDIMSVGWEDGDFYIVLSDDRTMSFCDARLR